MKHSNWGDKKAPKDYFSNVGSIASIISSLLMAPSEGYSPAFYSTIQVHQSKEKFGAVRVYCELCSLEKVKLIYKTDKVTMEMLEAAASHYRYVYKQVISLFPQYKQAITSAADYPALLLDSKEEYLQLVGKYHTGFDDSEEVQEMLTKVCGWK
jgi:hypothetical protein